MTERRPYDPFAPNRGAGERRPRRSTADDTLPSWLFAAMRERDVPEAAIEALTAQFDGLNPAERASALADLQTFRRSTAEIDDLAAGLIEFVSGDDDETPAGDAQGGSDGDVVENTSEGDEPATDDLVTSGGTLVEAVTVDDVPRNANEAVAWIGDSPDEDALRARARLVLDVERSYPSPRKTVRQALDLALGADAVTAAFEGRG